MKNYLVLLLFILTTGCASVAIAPKPVLPDANTPVTEAPKQAPKAAEDKKAASLIEEIHLPEFKTKTPEKPLPPPAEPIDPKKVVHAEGNVIVNADNMPLTDFIIYALGDSLKATFFMDEQVKSMKDSVTFRMSIEMPPDKVFEAITGFLERKGLTLEEKGGALYILKSPTVQRQPLDFRFGRSVSSSPATIAQIVPLKHFRVAEMFNLINSLYKTNVTLSVYPRENSLMLTGPASSIKDILEVIELTDVPYLREKKLFLVPLTYWQTDEFIKQLTTILTGIGFTITGGANDSGILFIPIKYLNSILVVTPDETTMKVVADWTRRLDTPESAGSEEKSYTYNPKYSKASDLVESLKNLMEGAAASAKNPPPSAPSGTAVRSSLSIGNLRVASDDKRNIILIHSTPAEYRSVLTYLEKLDVPPKQVLIEATIAELTLKDDLSYGLEWYMKSRMKDGGYTISTLGKLGLSTGTGLAYQFISDSQNFQAALNAFALENRINIISSPRLMVLDNEEASIQIGTDVPTRTGSTTVTSGASTSVESIQYRSTGLVLRVKPTINAEGTLILILSIESSDSQKNTMSAIDSPLILTRRINTMVAAATGQSIMLGGLISENKGETQSKIPIIGDIPLLGNLFKSTSKNKIKTELIILITPTIITSAENAAVITNEFRQGMKWFR